MERPSAVHIKAREQQQTSLLVGRRQCLRVSVHRAGICRRPQVAWWPKLPKERCHQFWLAERGVRLSEIADRPTPDRGMECNVCWIEDPAELLRGFIRPPARQGRQAARHLEDRE